VIANHDNFTIASDRVLTVNVTSNDEGLPATTSFSVMLVPPPTYTTPTSTTPVNVNGGFQLTAQGTLSFSPAAAGSLKPGTVVKFMYYIQPIQAGSVRSNNATVTITITDSGESCEVASGA
jgi:hypothetical protein